VSLDGDIQEKMENNDMFVSAMDSPTDSGLETNKTSNSDTMEDLSLQDEKVDIPAMDVNLDDDLGVSEVNLDDDDDIFKSARLEPEPAKVNNDMNDSKPLTNGHSEPSKTREVSEEPVETDIPLEDDDDRPFDNAHLKPGLQLQSEPATINVPHQTLTSFPEEEAKRELESGDEFIEVKVTSPHKVGEGMSSFMAYKVITKTNLSYFKKTNPEVNRRFSDFLGLRDKLSEKYLQNGRIIPPCPDKSVLGMTKVKMSKEEDASSQSELLKREEQL